MKRLVILTLIIVCTSCKSNLHSGKYSLNFPTYGMFSSSIELKSDSTFVKNFSGDMMNDSSIGKWSVNKDTLTLNFDTINFPKGRYTKSENYLIKNKRLVPNQNLINLLKSMGVWDTLPKKYKKNAVRISQKSPKDFRGTMRNQYYQLEK